MAYQGCGEDSEAYTPVQSSLSGIAIDTCVDLDGDASNGNEARVCIKEENFGFSRSGVERRQIAMTVTLPNGIQYLGIDTDGVLKTVEGRDSRGKKVTRRMLTPEIVKIVEPTNKGQSTLTADNPYVELSMHEATETYDEITRAADLALSELLLVNHTATVSHPR